MLNCISLILEIYCFNHSTPDTNTKMVKSPLWAFPYVTSRCHTVRSMQNFALHRMLQTAFKLDAAFKRYNLKTYLRNILRTKSRCRSSRLLQSWYEKYKGSLGVFDAAPRAKYSGQRQPKCWIPLAWYWRYTVLTIIPRIQTQKL